MEPQDLRYHKEHEWIRVDGKKATLGISNFAQDALGDVVFIDLPQVGASLAADAELGEIESDKGHFYHLFAGHRLRCSSQSGIGRAP